MKRLKNIPCNDRGDLMYGQSIPEEGKIYINIQYIWNKHKNFKKFVNDFVGTYNHELMHVLIQQELGKRRRTILGEENIIRHLLHEPFNQRLKKYYKEEAYRRDV